MNRSIKKENFESNILAYEEIFFVENTLRTIILDKMNDYKLDWWNDLNNKFVERVEKLKEADDLEVNIMLKRIQKKIDEELSYNSIDVILMHDIYYTNLMDLYLIIKRYWNDVFRNVITGKSIHEFRISCEVSNKIRNKVMHSKPITNRELKELNTFASFLEERIQSSEIINDFFNSYVSLKYVLNDFSDELQSHSEAIESEYYHNNIFKNEVYIKYNSEWWWNSKFFNDYLINLVPYYDKLELINITISDHLKDLKHIFEIDQHLTRLDFRTHHSNIIELLREKIK